MHLILKKLIVLISFACFFRYYIRSEKDSIAFNLQFESNFDCSPILTSLSSIVIIFPCMKLCLSCFVLFSLHFFFLNVINDGVLLLSVSKEEWDIWLPELVWWSHMVSYIEFNYWVVMYTNYMLYVGAILFDSFFIFYLFFSFCIS